MSRKMLLAIVLIYAASFRLLVLNRPFAYDAEGSGCLNGVLARNYLRFGWMPGYGVPILSSGPPDTAIVLYPDHPPLVPLLITPVYAAFGVGPWQTRLPFAIATVLAIVALYRLLARSGSARTGLIAAALFASTPMTLYFGGFPDVVGVPLILFVLWTLTAYVPFHQEPTSRGLARLLAAFALAALCDWPAYVLVPVLVVHFAATRPRSEWPWIVAFGGAACGLFAATYAYITVAGRLSWDWMAPLFRRRSALIGGVPFGWREWVKAAVDFNRTYHTVPLLVVSAVAIGAIVLRPRESGRHVRIARLLLAWASVYLVIGAKAMYNHEWAWMPFTPALAVAAALLLERILASTERVGLAAAGRSVVAIPIAGFALFTAVVTYRDLAPSSTAEPYTAIEMGQAIRAAAPGAHDVALVFGGDDSAQMWFYGDRGLRLHIWSIDGLRRRLDDDTVDLMFDFDEQPWKARATGFVFPRDADREFFQFHDYMTEHYRRIPLAPGLASRFDVFDLRPNRTTAEQRDLGSEDR